MFSLHNLARLDVTLVNDRPISVDQSFDETMVLLHYIVKVLHRSSAVFAQDLISFLGRSIANRISGILSTFMTHRGSWLAEMPKEP